MNRRLNESQEERMTSHTIRQDADLVGLERPGQQLVDLLRHHEPVESHVAPVVEREGLAREHEDSDVGVCTERFLQKAQEGRDIDTTLVGVIVDEEGMRSGQIHAQNVACAMRFPPLEGRLETRFPQFGEESTEAGEHRGQGIPWANSMPEEVTRAPQIFANSAREGRFPDSGHSSDDENP